MSLMRFLNGARPAPSRFEAGRVGFAVGDIHGRADLLGALVVMLEERADSERRDGCDAVVIFLGDYVDRGPHSHLVLDMLLSGRPRGYARRFLRGNHEQAMLAFMDAPMENRSWLLQGGAETMRAYGVNPPPPFGAPEEAWVETASQLRASVPEAHVEFLQRLERYVVFGDYAFVHAGVDPLRPLEQQTDHDLYWIRERFILNKRRYSHRIVHGHTPVERPFADHRRVAVDTGAYASGVLTAARFEGEQLDFLSVSDRDLRRSAQPQPAGPL